MPRRALFRRVYYNTDSALRHIIDVPPAARVPIAAKTGNHLATPG